MSDSPEVSETEEQNSQESPGSEEPNKVSGPLGIEFSCDPGIWNEARRLITEKNTRVEDLAICISQDPVLVMELLKVSNAMYFSGGRSAITTVKTAIVRLGEDVVLENLEKIKERPVLEDEDVRHWFETHRSRCKRTSIIARLLAEAIARSLADDCQTAGLLSCVGEMLAVAHLGRDYVELAEEHSRSGVNYRLAQDHKFDVERMGLNYLRRAGIPEALLFALDRDAASRSPERAQMRPLVQAAGEMVDAFDLNRWEKLAPGKTVPPKSAIRLLKVSDSQYLKIYERASEYLFSARLLEERKRQEAIRAQEMAQAESEEAAAEEALSSDQAALESEIQNILNFDSTESEEAEEVEEEDSAPVESEETEIASVETDLNDPADQFSLASSKQKSKSVPRVQDSPKPAQKPQLRTAKGNKFVSAVTDMFDYAESSEQMISDVLALLVDEGPFEQTALIVVSRDRTSAIVVASRGSQYGSGQKIELDDPLSPLAQCFSKVQSFGNKESESSPFGSKAFALSPIDADHDTPVALYADCGNDGAITFEARRIFRTVVDILNERLPHVPGGIPVELSE